MVINIVLLNIHSNSMHSLYVSNDRKLTIVYSEYDLNTDKFFSLFPKK